MPTRDEFLLAADKLASAAEQVGALMSAAENTDADRVLRGGALGTQIPVQIAETARTAQICRIMIDRAAETCRERAAVIELYEHELAAYEIALNSYRSDYFEWSYQSDSYLFGDSELGPYPGERPRRPTPPDAPPAWADVRRIFDHQ